MEQLTRFLRALWPCFLQLIYLLSAQTTANTALAPSAGIDLAGSILKRDQQASCTLQTALAAAQV